MTTLLKGISFPTFRETQAFASFHFNNLKLWQFRNGLSPSVKIKLVYDKKNRGFPDSSVGKESACNAGDPRLIPGSGRSPGEGIGYPFQYSWASLVAQLVKNPPAMQETWVRSLGWENPLEKGKVTHSSIMAWRIPWTIQQRIGHDWATFTFMTNINFYEKNEYKHQPSVQGNRKCVGEKVMMQMAIQLWPRAASTSLSPAPRQVNKHRLSLGCSQQFNLSIKNCLPWGSS